MKQRAFLLLSSLAGLAILVSACGSGSAGDPADAVERYLEAKIQGDASALGRLLCAELESTLERESRTFESVSDVRLEDMACQDAGDGMTVTCSGRIVATYGTEDTEFQLSNYRVVQEDGEWKWCGETSNLRR
jgi:hypothetical protein